MATAEEREEADQVEQRAVIGARFCLEQSCRIKRLAAGPGFGEGKVEAVLRVLRLPTVTPRPGP